MKKIFVLSDINISGLNNFTLFLIIKDKSSKITEKKIFILQQASIATGSIEVKE